MFLRLYVAKIQYLCQYDIFNVDVDSTNKVIKKGKSRLEEKQTESESSTCKVIPFFSYATDIGNYSVSEKIFFWNSKKCTTFAAQFFETLTVLVRWVSG